MEAARSDGTPGKINAGGPWALVLVPCCTACGYLFGDKGVFRDKSERLQKSRRCRCSRVPGESSSAALGDVPPIPPITDNILARGAFQSAPARPRLTPGRDERSAHPDPG